jgi:predicted O-methyltransferase YrrM
VAAFSPSQQGPTQTPPWTPGRLFEVSGSYWQTCALHAAVKLDLFSHLASRPQPADALAGEVGVDPRALEMLLNAVTAMGLLEKSGDRFACTNPARRYLRRSSEEYLGHMLLHHHHLYDAWGMLDAAVRTGKAVRGRASVDDAARRESFLMGMFNLAMQVAPRVAEAIDLAGRKRLLDLGGGPGTYAVHFCRENPGLSATVFDLPTSRPFAEKTIARFGLQERVTFAPGDFHQDPVAGRFDVVWLSHILHAEGPVACRHIIARAVAALSPGGLLLVHDFFLGDDRAHPLFPALFALNMLLATAAGQAYSESEVRGMLAESGVSAVRRLDIQMPNDSGILMGSLP